MRRVLCTAVLAVTTGWAAAIGAAATSHTRTTQKTTNDGVYSAAQADKAKADFDKLCASCHAFAIADRKSPNDTVLGGDAFIAKWTGRPVADLVSVITMTMPNDGSAVVEEPQAIDITAYILQRNGYPAGAAPLTKDTAAATFAPKKLPAATSWR